LLVLVLQLLDQLAHLLQFRTQLRHLVQQIGIAAVVGGLRLQRGHAIGQALTLGMSRCGGH
jgi:hypothetical protein